MAGCMALACPRLKNLDPDNGELSIVVPTFQLTRDKAGNTWCNHCQKQRELMDFAHANHWPAVRVQSLTHQGHYAITADYAGWFMGVAMGNADMIDALYTRLIEQAQPPSAA